MTTLEYKVEPDQERKSEIDYLFPHVELSLYSDEAKIEFDLSHRDLGNGSYSISFDPAIPLENLLISIDGYYKRVFAPLEISLSAEDTGKTLTVGDFSLTVRISLDVKLADTLSSPDWIGPFVSITIDSPSVAFIDATVSDSAGMRDALRCEYWLNWPEIDQRYSSIIFSTSDTEWSLVVEPYILYTMKNITITP